MELGRLITDWRRWLLPRPNSHSVLAHYLPMAGAVSHALYSVHIFTPQLLARTFRMHDISVECTLLCTATVGPGFYVYFRPHMTRLRKWERVQYSVFAAVMFTYGSLFAAILIKDIVPTSLTVWVKSAIAVGLSWLLWSRGYNYLSHLDRTRIIRTKDSVNGLLSTTK